MKIGRHIFALPLLAFSASCSGELSTEPSVPADLEITVEYLKQGTTSVSVPVVGAFLTLDPSRNLVICATSQSGRTDCYPDDEFVRSDCPATERCSYSIWRDEDGPVAISVFSMNLVGKGFADQALDALSSNPDLQQGELGSFLGNAREMNSKRAIWLSSFIISDSSLDPFGKGQLESFARDAVVAKSMPGTADPDEGALSAPFETCLADETGYWLCRPLRDVSLEAVGLPGE